MKEKETEALIRKTAKRMFFGEGRLNAKLHEIAKEAGINRALLHYYFRSRENLFETVFREAMDDSFLTMFAILSGDRPFEKKIESAIHHIIDVLAEYPYIESFIISEINKDPSAANALAPIAQGQKFTHSFLKEVRHYLKKHHIKGITPEHFIVNMMALCAYPSGTKPIIRSILKLSEKEYSKFLAQRKKMLVDLVLMKQRKVRH